METKAEDTKTNVEDISKIKHSAFYVTSDGTSKIFCRSWKTEDYGVAKRGTVVFVHALGDHCSRYSHVFEEFAKAGFQVDSFDQRGFGYSGTSSHADLTFDEVVQDLQFVYGKASSDLPRFLYGVNMGAVVAAQFVLKHAEEMGKKDSPYHVDGVILAAPLLRSKVAKSTFRRSTMKLRGMVTPTTNTAILKDVQHLSRDASVVANYQEDKLVNKKASLSFINDVIESSDKVLHMAAEIKVPALVIHGEQDKIATVAATKQFFEELGSAEKEYKCIPQLFHDIYHEPEKDQVIKETIEWVLKRLPEEQKPKKKEKKEKKEKKVKKEKKTKKETKEEAPTNPKAEVAEPEAKPETKQEPQEKPQEKLAEKETKEEPKKTEEAQPTESKNENAPSTEAKAATAKQPVPGKQTAEDFEFLETIGKGAFGEVKHIKHKKTGQDYAVKMLNKKFIQDSGKAKYVHTERNIFNKLNHPNVVKLSYTFQDPKTLYYVLELCPNGSLLSELQRVGRFSEESARFYLAEVINGLEHMHSKGVVHRDLKPDNVLLGQNMHAKLTDFGTSKEIGTETRARSDSFCGTEEYVSPELLDEEAPYASKSSDMWALGCIAFQLLTGKVPFKGDTAYNTFQLIKKRDFVMPDTISPEARDLIDKLLVVDAEQRLGVGEDGYQKLKSHPFFAGIDFATLHKQEPPKITKAAAPATSTSVTEETKTQEKSTEEKPKKEKKEKKEKKSKKEAKE